MSGKEHNTKGRKKNILSRGQHFLFLSSYCSSLHNVLHTCEDISFLWSFTKTSRQSLIAECFMNIQSLQMVIASSMCLLFVSTTFSDVIFSKSRSKKTLMAYLPSTLRFGSAPWRSTHLIMAGLAPKKTLDLAS